MEHGAAGLSVGEHVVAMIEKASDPDRSNRSPVATASPSLRTVTTLSTVSPIATLSKVRLVGVTTIRAAVNAIPPPPPCPPLPDELPSAESTPQPPAEPASGVTTSCLKCASSKSRVASAMWAAASGQAAAEASIMTGKHATSDRSHESVTRLRVSAIAASGNRQEVTPPR